MKWCSNCQTYFDDSFFYCPQCGHFLLQNFNFNSNTNWEYGYSYKCPYCNGEFNYPSRDGMKYVCPFCNKEMKGIK